MNISKPFGEQVDGFTIRVLNEREVRASAGILFAVMFSAVALIELKGNYLLLKYFISLFLVDFIFRVFVHPRFSPTLILGRMIVSNQNPEWVGAAQKKFAWMIGLALASVMFVLMVVINSRSIISSVICGMCVLFLFFESAFGICLGCLCYRWFYKERAQYCPGEICDTASRQHSPKITALQMAIVAGFIILTLVMIYFFNDLFSLPPRSLWDVGGFKR
ncbi:MAG TPA: DUF4395 domain-containing protein [Puia sp.]|nr:DUF4395 domain-containing protein [Puia sp.]